MFRWGHPGRALMGASCAGQLDIFWEEWLEAVSQGVAFRGTIEAHSAAEIPNCISGLIACTTLLNEKITRKTMQWQIEQFLQHYYFLMIQT